LQKIPWHILCLLDYFVIRGVVVLKQDTKRFLMVRVPPKGSCYVER